MANRRMFSKSVLDSDKFIEMSLSAQALYVALAIRADDDGFTNNPKTIMRMINADISDYNELLSKNFIIAFDSGVIAITHWKMHNSIKPDRYKPTVYNNEKSMLIENKDKSYRLCIQNGSKMDALCLQNGSIMEPQYRLDKDSIGKVR